MYYEGEQECSPFFCAMNFNNTVFFNHGVNGVWHSGAQSSYNKGFSHKKLCDTP